MDRERRAKRHPAPRAGSRQKEEGERRDLGRVLAMEGIHLEVSTAQLRSRQERLWFELVLTLVARSLTL